MGEVASGRTQSWADAAQGAGYGFTSGASRLGLRGLLFRSGERTSTTGVVDALGAENPFVAGTVSGHYATATASPQVLTSSFVAIPLSRSVPPTVLLARGLGILTRAGLVLEGRSRVPIDGGFDRTFTLYSDEGRELDALEIFAPTVMDQLLATTGGCDVELVDDWMFVYGEPGRYRTGAALAAVEDAAAIVRSAVARQLVVPTSSAAQSGGASRVVLLVIAGIGAIVVALVARWYVTSWILPGF